MSKKTFKTLREITIPTFGSITGFYLPVGSIVTATEGNRGYWFVTSGKAPSLVMSVRRRDLERVTVN